MENNLSYTVFNEKILELLRNPGRYDHVSFFDESYRNNRDVVFPTMLNEENPSSPAECCSYLLGKAMEMRITQKVRPQFQRVWLAPEEVTSNIVLNLPKHLEDIVLEAMAGCEEAVEEFIAEKNPDVKELMMNCQYIAEHLVNEMSLYSVKFKDYSNNDIAFPSELYVFTNNVILKQLTEQGYKINGVTNNMNSPVSCVLTSPEGEKMIVLENITVAPKTAKFQGYLKDAASKVAEKENGKAYMLGIMLEPQDEGLVNTGIVLKNGQTAVKRTDFLPIR